MLTFNLYGSPLPIVPNGSKADSKMCQPADAISSCPAEIPAVLVFEASSKAWRTLRRHDVTAPAIRVTASRVTIWTNSELLSSADRFQQKIVEKLGRELVECAGSVMAQRHNRIHSHGAASGD